MKKIDYKKEFKQLYTAKSGVFQTVTVPKMNYIKIDGSGGPASKDWASAIETLYPIAYTIKFICKIELESDFIVMPLEGLWWMEDMNQFSEKVKDQWLWSAMIMQPNVVTKEVFEQALKKLQDKGKHLPLLDRVSFETLDEGRSAQTLHIGPYDAEAPTIAKLHAHIEAEGGELSKSTHHHHEIYLSDARKVSPDKLKTILRQPF